MPSLHTAGTEWTLVTKSYNSLPAWSLEDTEEAVTSPPERVSSVGFKVPVLSTGQRPRGPPWKTQSPLWEAAPHPAQVSPPPTHSSHSHQWSRNNTARPVFLPAAGSRQGLFEKENKRKSASSCFTSARHRWPRTPHADALSLTSSLTKMPCGGKTSPLSL